MPCKNCWILNTRRKKQLRELEKPMRNVSMTLGVIMLVCLSGCGIFSKKPQQPPLASQPVDCPLPPPPSPDLMERPKVTNFGKALEKALTPK